MLPKLFQIGPIPVHSYGLMLAISFMTGIFLTVYRAQKVKIDPNQIMDLAVYILVSSIVGARLLYVFVHFEEYKSQPLDIINIFKGLGGLNFYGGFLSAIIISLLFLKKRKLNVWLISDLIAPSIAIGLALTRIGCFLNGCCFGRPTNFFTGIIFPQTSLAGMAFPDVHIHPTQLYESLFGVFLFLFLLGIERFKKFDGYLFWMLIIVYSIYRFFIDFIRYYEEAMVLFDGVNINQGISLLIFIVSCIMIFKNKKEI